MQYAIYAFLLSVAVILPAGASDDLPSVEVVKADSVWQFSQVKIKEQASFLAVSGRINAHNHIGLPNGHVDIAAWSSDGKLIAEITTNHSPVFLTRGKLQREGVNFSANLPGVIPPDAIIKVAFHRDSPKTKTEPVHFETVAR